MCVQPHGQRRDPWWASPEGCPGAVCAGVLQPRPKAAVPRGCPCAPGSCTLASARPWQRGPSRCQQAALAWVSPDGPYCGETASLPIGGPGGLARRLLLKTNRGTGKNLGRTRCPRCLCPRGSASSRSSPRDDSALPRVAAAVATGTLCWASGPPLPTVRKPNSLRGRRPVPCLPAPGAEPCRHTWKEHCPALLPTPKPSHRDQRLLGKATRCGERSGPDSATGTKPLSRGGPPEIVLARMPIKQ